METDLSLPREGGATAVAEGVCNGLTDILDT